MMDKEKVRYFDYISLAKECQLTEEQLNSLEALERAEFPRDQMMFELHMLRVIQQILAGRIKIEDILSI